MRITNEADYALRFLCVLAGGGQRSAKAISEETGVTLRFALKILRKLALAGVVGSQQGAAGGYFLSRPPEALSVGEVVEIIDGPLQINNCIDESYCCSRTGLAHTDCRMHLFFSGLNERLRREMYAATIDRFL